MREENFALISFRENSNVCIRKSERNFILEDVKEIGARIQVSGNRIGNVPQGA
jgi:hypothetical protein